MDAVEALAFPNNLHFPLSHQHIMFSSLLLLLSSMLSFGVKVACMYYRVCSFDSCSFAAEIFIFSTNTLFLLVLPHFVRNR